MKSLIEFLWWALGAVLVAGLGVLWHLYMASSLPGARGWYTFYATPGHKPIWPAFDIVVPMFLLAPFAAGFISGERRWFTAFPRALTGAAAYAALVSGMLVVYVYFRLSPPPKPLPIDVFFLLFVGFSWLLVGMCGWYARRQHLVFVAAVRRARDSIRNIILIADDELEPGVKRLRVELTNGDVRILRRRHEVTQFIEMIRPQLPKVARCLHAQTIVQRPWYRPARNSRRRQKTLVYEQGSYHCG